MLYDRALYSTSTVALCVRRFSCPLTTPAATGVMLQPRPAPARRMASRTFSLLALLPGVTTTGSTLTLWIGREVQPVAIAIKHMTSSALNTLVALPDVIGPPPRP